MLNRRRHGQRVFAYFLAELLVLGFAMAAAWWLRDRTTPFWGRPVGPLLDYLWILPIALTVWSALIWSLNTYAMFRSRGLLLLTFKAAATSVLGVLALFSVLNMIQAHEVNRSLVGLFGVTSFASLFVSRVAAITFLVHYTQKGYDRHYVLVGGTGEEAVVIAESLESIRGAVYQVRGFLSEIPELVGQTRGRWTVLGTFEDVVAIAKAEPVDEVWLLPKSSGIEEMVDMVARCETMGMTVRLRLAPFERLMSRLSLTEAAGGDYLTFDTAPRRGVLLGIKRAIDVAGAVGMLAVLWPLLLAISALIRLTSRGPAVFRQERAGMNGRRFTLYKFRTMRDGAELERSGLTSKNEMEGPVFKVREDPRVTGIGRLLRKSSIDELPQLWNVLKGDMSLVGPRPLPMYEVDQFEPWQRRRMSMRPGITCLWQVMGRNRVASFTEWMKLDLEYVDRWSIALDVKILVRTIPAVLGGKGAY